MGSASCGIIRSWKCPICLIMPKMPDVLPEEVNKELSETSDSLAENAAALSAIQEGMGAAKEIGEGVKEVGFYASAAKTAAQGAARSTKNTVQHYVRRLPRSEREANELIVTKSERFNRRIRSRFDSFMRKHPKGIFRSKSK